MCHDALRAERQWRRPRMRMMIPWRRDGSMNESPCSTTTTPGLRKVLMSKEPLLLLLLTADDGDSYDDGGVGNPLW